MKTGADDFLVARAGLGRPAWKKLEQKAIPLGHPIFRAFREREKAVARATERAAAVLPKCLDGRRVHPALHFDRDGFASVGLVTLGADGTPVVELITSTRERVPALAAKGALTRPAFAYPGLLDRWRLDDVGRFVVGKDERPTFAEMIARVITVLDDQLDLAVAEGAGDREKVLIATWIAATYVFPVFLAFPRLDLRGEKGSGKSKLLAILAETCFNGLLRVAPTPAVLFRLIEALRPTLGLDEIEGLDRDEARELLAIVNAGYKAGERVDRCEKGPDGQYEVRSYDIYAPMALAGIRGLNRVTEDRAITLVLTRGRAAAQLNMEVDPADPRFAAIRDAGYRLALLRHREVADALPRLELPPWLVARERELWRPLLAVASLADREADLGLVPDLLALAKAQGEERGGLSDEAEAVVTVLRPRLNGSELLVVEAGALREPLQAALHWDRPPSAQAVGLWLKRLGFKKAPRKAERRGWLIPRAALAELEARYRVDADDVADL